jgi:hypothetical protein
VRFIVVYEGSIILLDTNVLTKLVESLDCKLSSCEYLITGKLFCNCSLDVSIIIPKEALKELRRCKEEVEFCLLTYEKLVAIGGKRIKHRVLLVSYKELSKRLRMKLKIVYSLKDYEEALKDVRDVVDKSLINVSLIKANNCRRVRSGVVVLLTMDRKLREKLHDLISKIQLINHILIPNISLNTLDKCLDTECFIRCVLQGV